MAHAGDGRTLLAANSLVEPPYSTYQFPVPYLTNLSGRAQIGEGENVIIAGLVSWKAELYPTLPVLLRGVGPTLAKLGVANATAHPVLDVFDRGGALVATNAGWTMNPETAEVGQQLGGFPLNDKSADAALVKGVLAGPTTIVLRDALKSGGIGLVEIYQAVPVNLYYSLRNLSLRARTGPGEQTAIAGFVISDPQNEKRYARVLLRAVGPTLRRQGILHPIENPVLTVYDSRGAKIAENDDWGAGSGGVSVEMMLNIGAFPLDEGSRDSALLLDLPSGAYTLHATGGEGVVLLEIYFVTTKA